MYNGRRNRTQYWVLSIVVALLLLVSTMLGCGKSVEKNTEPEIDRTQWRKKIMEDEDWLWRSFIADIAKKYNPNTRKHEIVFYGASNFAYWETMEEDLSPYVVQNHAFGGSTDKDLLHWAEYMLYAYEPDIVVFQTGSNDYANSTAETAAEKLAEAKAMKERLFAELHEQLPETRFVIMSGILLPGRAEYVDITLELNDWLREFCEDKEYMYYVDAEALTYIRGSGFVEDVDTLFIEDQIHLTPEARITWAQQWILPMLETLTTEEQS